MASAPEYVLALRRYGLSGDRSRPFVASGASVLGESDRAAIILLAATVENQLDILIENQIVSNLNSDDRNRLFGPNGVFGSFSSKIIYLYAVGLLDKKAKRDLDLLREIRNACAHCPVEISLSVEELRVVCVKLIGNAGISVSEAETGTELIRHGLMLACIYMTGYLRTHSWSKAAAELSAALGGLST